MPEYVGNDIVDLARVDPAKHLEERFIRRVCTNYELELLRKSSEPELLIWSLWACKETAFKLVSKIDLPPTFVHKKFECGQFSRYGRKAKAHIRFDDHAFQIHLSLEQNYIHAIGYFDAVATKADSDAGVARISGAKKRELSDWRSLFSDRELSTITRFESAFVRLRCKEALAKRFGFEIRDLEIMRPVENHQSLPPFLLVDGERSRIDISLSHHGDWAGWAYCQVMS